MSTIDKGNAWRRRLVVLFEAAGFHVTVRGIGFAGDDLKVKGTGVELSVEAKNHARYDFAGWVSQAEDNAEGTEVPVVFAHRNGRSAAEDGYVVMSGRAFVSLLGALARDDNVEVIDTDDVIVTDGVK